MSNRDNVHKILKEYNDLRDKFAQTAPKVRGELINKLLYELAELRVRMDEIENQVDRI